MDLKAYFENKKGFGVLGTADDKGKVNAAPYAGPYVIDETHVAFVMGARLSHANITKNPYAVYLFREEGLGYEGKRLYLVKEKESDNQQLIESTCKIAWHGPYCREEYLKGSFIVYFRVESVLPLVGDE